MKQYVLRKVNGDVRKRFVADIISTDAGMGLFYIDTPDGPELIAAIKLGVGDVIESEGCQAPAFDKVKVESTVEGNYEYVTVEQLVERFSNVRKSLQWHINAYTRKVKESQDLVERLRLQAHIIQNLSEINKQYETNGLIKDPSQFAWGKDTNQCPEKQVPGAQVTHGFAGNAQAEQQGARQGAQSRFDLNQECEDFFRDND